MDQYHPAYRAADLHELNRPIRRDEYEQALAYAHQAGLKRLDKRKPLWDL
jgi:uncharacterized Fe-S radical SAM superfamily protein PflX